MHVCHWGPVTDGPPRDGSHRVLPELQAPAEAVPKRRQSWYPPYFIVLLSWCSTLCMINFQNKTMHKRDRGPAFDCPSRNGAYRVLPELSTSAEVVPRWSKSWYWTANLKNTIDRNEELMRDVLHFKHFKVRIFFKKMLKMLSNMLIHDKVQKNISKTILKTLKMLTLECFIYV